MPTKPNRRSLDTSLTPDGPAPETGAQWCPRCKNWTLREVIRVMPAWDWARMDGSVIRYPERILYRPKRKRCAACNSALVRPVKAVTPKKGELRPGIVAEW